MKKSPNNHPRASTAPELSDDEEWGQAADESFIQSPDASSDEDGWHAASLSVGRNDVTDPDGKAAHVDDAADKGDNPSDPATAIAQDAAQATDANKDPKQAPQAASDDDTEVLVGADPVVAAPAADASGADTETRTTDDAAGELNAQAEADYDDSDITRKLPRQDPAQPAAASADVLPDGETPGGTKQSSPELEPDINIAVDTELARDDNKDDDDTFNELTAPQSLSELLEQEQTETDAAITTEEPLSEDLLKYASQNQPEDASPKPPNTSIAQDLDGSADITAVTAAGIDDSDVADNGEQTKPEFRLDLAAQPNGDSDGQGDGESGDKRDDKRDDKGGNDATANVQADAKADAKVGAKAGSKIENKPDTTSEKKSNAKDSDTQSTAVPDLTAESTSTSPPETVPAAIPAPTRSGWRRGLAIFAIFVVGAGIAALTVLGHLNSQHFYISCPIDGESNFVGASAEQGRSFPPWGKSSLEGPAWQTIPMKRSHCKERQFADKTALAVAFGEDLIAEVETWIIKSAPEADDQALDSAEIQLEQALSLGTIADLEDQRAPIESLIGDIYFWRAQNKIAEAQAHLELAAKNLEEAHARQPQHASDVSSWQQFLTGMRQSLGQGPIRDPLQKPKPGDAPTQPETSLPSAAAIATQQQGLLGQTSPSDSAPPERPLSPATTEVATGQTAAQDQQAPTEPIAATDATAENTTAIPTNPNTDRAVAAERPSTAPTVDATAPASAPSSTNSDAGDSTNVAQPGQPSPPNQPADTRPPENAPETPKGQSPQPSPPAQPAPRQTPAPTKSADSAKPPANTVKAPVEDPFI